jgi:hypothetical protein
MARSQQSGATRGGTRRNRATQVTRRRRGSPSEGQYQKAFELWKGSRRQPGVEISRLAAKLNIRRGALRHHLERLAGGHEEFKALREAGAGGLRPSLGERPADPNLDRGARVLTSRRRKNWKHRYITEDEVKVPVFIDGRENMYVPATARQKADVIALMDNGLPPARLVSYTPERAD